MWFRRNGAALTAALSAFWCAAAGAAQIGCQSGDPGDVLVCQSGGIAQWSAAVGQAPADGAAYGRSNGAWVPVLTAETDPVASAALAAYSPLGHGHPISEVSGLQAALDGKLSASVPAAGISAPDLATWDAAAAGRRAWVDLGDVADVLLSQHGATVEARLIDNGELTLTPPTDGAYYTTLILSTASPTGAYELTAVGAVGWLAGSAGLRPEPGRDVELVCLQTPSRAVCSAAYVELP